MIKPDYVSIYDKEIPVQIRSQTSINGTRMISRIKVSLLYDAIDTSQINMVKVELSDQKQLNYYYTHCIYEKLFQDIQI